MTFLNFALKMKKHKEKIIIVTGGSGLIGKSIVNQILNDGNIPLNLDVFDSKSPCTFINCNITDNNEVEKAFEHIYENFGKIDGLVNNAYPRKKEFAVDFQEVQEKQLVEQLHFQLASYFLCCQQAIKYMKRNNGGSIVNISSIYGSFGNDFSLYQNTNMNPPGVYNMVKGGVNSLTNYLAAKFGKDKIRVNTVSPGGIFDGQHKEFVERYSTKVPLSRMGNPEDISPLVSFLLSDKANYLTGQNIMVDGGLTCI